MGHDETLEERESAVVEEMRERRQRVVSRLKTQLQLLPLSMFAGRLSRSGGEIYTGWLLIRWEKLERNPIFSHFLSVILGCKAASKALEFFTRFRSVRSSHAPVLMRTWSTNAESGIEGLHWILSIFV